MWKAQAGIRNAALPVIANIWIRRTTRARCAKNVAAGTDDLVMRGWCTLAWSQVTMIEWHDLLYDRANGRWMACEVVQLRWGPLLS